MSFGSGSPSLKVEGQGTEAERGVVLLVAVFRRGIAGWRREKSNIKDDKMETGKLGFLYKRGTARVMMLGSRAIASWGGSGTGGAGLIRVNMLGINVTGRIGDKIMVLSSRSPTQSILRIQLSNSGLIAFSGIR